MNMKRCIRVLPFVAFLSVFPSALMAADLITGASRSFEPGDVVVFKDDFSNCPVGELPESYDKLEGSGECVAYQERHWFTSIVGWTMLMKAVDLTGKDFSIEFDAAFLGGECGETELRLYKGKELGREDLPYTLRVGPGCSGEAIYVGFGPLGRILRTDYKSVGRTVHMAIQKRRNQIRVFMDGKRLAMLPFQGEVRSISIRIPGKHVELISGIRIATYSGPELVNRLKGAGMTVASSKAGGKLTVPASVLFDTDQFFLKPEAKEALALVAAYLRSEPERKVKIVGYTDSTGSDEHNLTLSLQRAQSVADYLIYVEGLDPNRIEIEGRGKANPVADNSTPEGRAKNRRVEIELH